MYLVTTLWHNQQNGLWIKFNLALSTYISLISNLNKLNWKQTCEKLNGDEEKCKRVEMRIFYFVEDIF